MHHSEKRTDRGDIADSGRSALAYRHSASYRDDMTLAHGAQSAAGLSTLKSGRVRICAEIAAGLLGFVVLFQLALVAGAPWGDATQGGRARTVDGVLQGSYRIMAGVSAVMLLVAMWVVLARAGIAGKQPAGRALHIAAWIVFAFLGLNTLTNLTGQHPFERIVMTLVSATAMALVGVVARSGPHAEGTAR